MIEIYKVTNDLVSTLNTVLPNVYPMLAPQGTSLPFVTYNRTGYESEGSKDCEYGVNLNYTINIISNTYVDGLQYLDAIRAALRKMVSTHYNYEVSIQGASEQAFDDGYVQILNIQIEASKK